MAEEKNYAQLVDQAHYKDHMGLQVPIHRSRRRERERKGYAQSEFTGQELKSGTRVILKTEEPRAYYLAAIIDFQDTRNVKRLWGFETHLIVQILDVSQEQDKDLVGRLQIASEGGSGWSNKSLDLIEIGKKNWGEYLPSGEPSSNDKEGE